MSLKYWALGLIVLGIAMMWKGFSADDNLNFEDGGFLTEGFLILVGIGCFILGVVLLGAVFFMGAP